MSIKTVLFSRISSFYWISSGKQLLLLSVPLLIAAKCFWILISCFSFSGSCRILLVIHSSKFLQLKFHVFDCSADYAVKFVMLSHSYFLFNLLFVIAEHLIPSESQQTYWQKSVINGCTTFPNKASSHSEGAGGFSCLLLKFLVLVITAGF